MTVDRQAEARTFLATLGGTRFTFQTFADRKDASDAERRRLTKVMHGPLDALWRPLERLNEDGAGIFVTVNETNLRGRKNSDIQRVRAVFVDLDGAPLPRHGAVPLVSQAGVKTSPGRWHLYWLVDGVPLKAFKPIQEALARRYSADEGVTDLARVMRLPGFYHRKGDPFLVRLLGTRSTPPYTLDELKAAWPQVAEALRPKPKANRKPIKATNTVATTYVEAALTGEWQAVKNTRQGGRNRQLNKSAFNLGTLLGAGLLTEDEAVNTLLDAVERAVEPLPEHEARGVIQRGLTAGTKHPRSIE